MAAFLYRMPYGIPGDVTRQSQATIEPHVYNSALPFPGFGLFGKIASGKFVPIANGDAAGTVYGLLVRPYPIQGANASDPLGTAVPPTTGIADVLKRGYASVRSNAGTPALGGAVYVRVATPSGAKVIGGVEAVSDGANTILVAGAQFMGAADASSNAEIAFNI